MRTIKMDNLSLKFLRDNLSPCFLGLTVKGEGEPTVESLQAELKTTQEKLTAAEAASKDWKAGIDPNHASNPNLQKIESPKALFESYMNLQTKLGDQANLIRPPKDAKDEAGRKALAKALGVPEDPKGYKFPEIKRPADFPADPKQEEAFRNMAKKYDLAPWQAEGLYKDVVESNMQTFSQQQASQVENVKKVETDLALEFGAAYPEKKELAQKVIDAYAPNDQKISEKLLSDPGVVRLLIKLGEKMSEDGLIEGGGGSGRLTPAEAKAKIAEIMNDDKHAYHKSDAAGHKEAVDYMNTLYEMANAKS